MRLLSLVLLLWMAWVMIKSFLNQQRWRAESRRDAERSLESGKIVKCRHCSVHLPEREALERDADWFCSREHIQAFLRDSGRNGE